MSCFTDFENMDDEIKELFKNYKNKRATIYEPCTNNNFKECLIGLSEELGLLNISYVFNPHINIEGETLSSDALIKLINAVWTLLHHYKNISEKCEALQEQNYILEHSNKQLNGSMGKLKNKLSTEKNESRACVASAQRVSDQSNEVYQKLIDTRAKLNHVVKQKEANEKSLQNKIARLRLENEKLTDKLRGKPGGYTPCADVCDATVRQLKEKEKKYKSIISQLQANNQELLNEVISMKEDLILSGLKNI
ncbi:unnamed protein product [Pieris macdunnoughi]|uniref:Afadin-and alpha-actinin-binding protein n=1 Tax=Pieris macdunnoughi TaxID=345717 RepID=A0A821TX74_9NEOP|nr:unnamed protein product [Pieris macdunnoughi]